MLPTITSDYGVHPKTAKIAARGLDYGLYFQFLCVKDDEMSS